MNIKLDEDVVLDVSDEALELALESAVNTPWAELAGGQGGIQLLTSLMRRSQPTDRVRLLRVVGTHSWAELTARRFQGAFTQLLTLLMRRSRLLLTGNPHLLGRGYSTLESAMNIELDEVVVLHVSDDALEQAAGGGQGGVTLLQQCIV